MLWGGFGKTIFYHCASSSISTPEALVLDVPPTLLSRADDVIE
jgi:hypothetical protein